MSQKFVQTIEASQVIQVLMEVSLMRFYLIVVVLMEDPLGVVRRFYDGLTNNKKGKMRLNCLPFLLQPSH